MICPTCLACDTGGGKRICESCIRDITAMGPKARIETLLKLESLATFVRLVDLVEDAAGPSWAPFGRQSEN